MNLAAQTGNTLALKKFKDLDYPIDVRNDQGLTPLSEASQYGQLEVVRLLLAEGASVETVNLANETPLLVAIKNG